jgi:hypothetical protein
LDAEVRIPVWLYSSAPNSSEHFSAKRRVREVAAIIAAISRISSSSRLRSPKEMPMNKRLLVLIALALR